MGGLSTGAPGTVASPPGFSPNKHLLDLMSLSHTSLTRAQEAASLCCGGTCVYGSGWEQPPRAPEPQDSSPHRSNCTCLQGFQENLPEMQELKTVNWDFQVTLSPFSLPTFLFTPEAKIGKAGVWQGSAVSKATS